MKKKLYNLGPSKSKHYFKTLKLSSAYKVAAVPFESHMEKPVFVGTTQPGHPHSFISAFVFSF